jgi:hypothetical protein
MFDTIDGDLLANISGGAGRSWAGVARDYSLACADGAVSATLMTGGTVAPYTSGVGCAAGMAGQGLTDAIQAYRARRR